MASLNIEPPVFITLLIGLIFSTFVPSPILPSALYPQHFTVPSERSATLPASPAATSITPSSPSTFTGADEFTFVPFPNCPLLLRPHVHTVPSTLSAII